PAERSGRLAERSWPQSFPVHRAAAAAARRGRLAGHWRGHGVTIGVTPVVHQIDTIRPAMDRDGAVHIAGFLSPEQIADAEAAFAWTKANPGPSRTGFPGDPGAWQDLSNPAAYQAYDAMLRRSPIPAMLKELWG